MIDTSAIDDAVAGIDAPQPPPDLARPEPTNFEQAKETLQMTPQEEYLYQTHQNNLATAPVQNEDGTHSTLKQTTVEIDGKTYNLPEVWDGAIHPDGKEVVAHAKAIGIDKFPSYGSEEEAQARYDKMHPFMERDTKDAFPPAPPQVPLQAAQNPAPPVAPDTSLIDSAMEDGAPTMTMQDARDIEADPIAWKNLDFNTREVVHRLARLDGPWTTIAKNVFGAGEWVGGALVHPKKAAAELTTGFVEPAVQTTLGAIKDVAPLALSAAGIRDPRQPPAKNIATAANVASGVGDFAAKVPSQVADLALGAAKLQTPSQAPLFDTLGDAVREVGNENIAGKNELIKALGGNPDSPESKVSEFLPWMVIPGGVEEAASPLIAKGIELGFERGIPAAGEVIRGAAKAAKSIAVPGAVAADVIASGGSATSIFTGIGALLTKYGGEGLPLLRQIKHVALEAPFDAVASLGNVLANAKDKTLLESMIEGVHSEAARLTQKVEKLKARHPLAAEDAFDVTANGEALNKADELTGPASEMRKLSEDIERRARLAQVLGKARRTWQVLSDATKYGLNVGGNMVTSGAVLDTFATASAPEGKEQEAGLQGFKLGVLLGGPGGVAAATHTLHGANTAKLIEGAQGAYDAHPLAKEADAAVAALSLPEQQYLAKLSGLSVLAKGKPIVPLHGPDMVKAYRAEGNGDAAIAPAGFDGKDVVYVNVDQGVATASHEIMHGTKLDSDPAVVAATHAMLDSPDMEVQAHNQAETDRYNADQRAVDPNAQDLDRDTLVKEIAASMGETLLAQTPPEMLFGGRSLSQGIKKIVKKAFPEGMVTLKGDYKFMTTPEMRSAMENALFKLGEDARLNKTTPVKPTAGAKVPIPSVVAAGVAAAQPPPPQHVVPDLITPDVRAALKKKGFTDEQINNLNPEVAQVVGGKPATPPEVQPGEFQQPGYTAIPEVQSNESPQVETPQKGVTSAVAEPPAVDAAPPRPQPEIPAVEVPVTPQKIEEVRAAANKGVEEKMRRAKSPERRAEIGQQARVDALRGLLPAGDGEGLRAVTDDVTGDVSYKGKVDPANPVDRALLDEFGYSPEQVQNVVDAQANFGKGVVMRDYNSAAQVGFEEGGADMSAKQRAAEYKASKPGEVGQREGDVSSQDKPFTPLDTVVTKKGVNIFGFDHDKFLNNVRAVLDAAHGAKLRTGYEGLTGEALDNEIAADFRTVSANHRIGASGDGSRQLEVFPDMGAKGKGKPQSVDPDRANVINMAMHDESAKPPTRATRKTPEAQAAEDLRFEKAQDASKQAIGLASLNRGFRTPEGEVNPLRDLLAKSGFDTNGTLKYPFDNLRPDFMAGGVHDTPGHGKSVHAHGFDIPAKELSAAGLPRKDFVSGGFKPKNTPSEIPAVGEADKSPIPEVLSQREDSGRMLPRSGGGLSEKDLEDHNVVARYQWMQNKEGGQAFGNQQVIVKTNDALFDQFVRPLLRPDAPYKTLADYEKHFGPEYLSLVKFGHDPEGGFQLAKAAGLAEVTPHPPDPSWVKKVDSFDSQEAVQHGSTADSDTSSARPDNAGGSALAQRATLLSEAKAKAKRSALSMQEASQALESIIQKPESTWTKDEKRIVEHGIKIMSGHVKAAPAGIPEVGGRMKPKNEDKNPGFYSPLERTIEAKMPARASSEQIRGIVNSGAKKAEIAWNSPLQDLLEKGGVHSKEDVLAAARAGTPKITFKTLTNEGGITPDERVATEEHIADLYRRGEEDKAQAVQERLDELPPPPQFDEHPNLQLPGGKNYREILMSVEPPPLPKDLRFEYQVRKDVQEALRPPEDAWGTDPKPIEDTDLLRRMYAGAELPPEDLARAKSVEATLSETHPDLAKEYQDAHGPDGKNAVFEQQKKQVFKGHFEGNNRVVAHARTTDRVTTDGRSMLFGEEGQSDIAKRIRELEQKVAAGKATPEEHAELQNLNKVTPFKGEGWQRLWLRTMIKTAVEEGKDSIGWTTGEQQAERYNLQNHLNKIEWSKEKGLDNPDGEHFVFMESKGEADDHDYWIDENGVITAARVGGGRNVVGKQFSEVVGKGLAQKILATPEGKLEGEGLKFGGEWAKQLYDGSFVNLANDIGKKFGAKVQDAQIPITPMRANKIGIQGEGDNVHTITDRSVGDWQETDAGWFTNDAHPNVGISESPGPYNDGYDTTPAAERKYLIWRGHEDTGATYDSLLEAVRSLDPESAKDTAETVHELPITDAMRKAVKEDGQPLFKPKNTSGVAGVAEPARGIPEIVAGGGAQRETGRPTTSAIDVLHGDSAILPKPDKPTTIETVAARIQEAAHNFWGREINSQNITPEEKATIIKNGADEAEAALKASGKNAAVWYTASIKRAMKVAAVLHPELEDHKLAAAAFPEAKDPVGAAQTGMRIALATTSQNLTVKLNTRFADEQFSILKKTGRFDPKRGLNYGEKAKMISGNLELANQMIDRLGWDRMDSFVNQNFTVRDLENTLHEVTGRKIHVEGKKGDLVNGAAMFGPKIGQGFLQNLMGKFDPVTIDLWLRRTWGRWTGDMLGDAYTGERVARLIQSARDAGHKLPEALNGLRSVVRQNKSGTSFSTLTDAALAKINSDSDPSIKDAIRATALDLESKWQSSFKLLKTPFTPEEASGFRSGEIGLDQALKIQDRRMRKLSDKFSSLSAEARKAAGGKEAWVKNALEQSGVTDALTNAEISKVKPEWANAAKIVKSSLNPISVPSPMDRRAITEVINGIRQELERRGHSTTNADVQAILWYPEKDLWSKLSGEDEHNYNTSYDEEFQQLADQRGLGDRARKAGQESAGESGTARSGAPVDPRADGQRGGEALPPRTAAIGTPPSIPEVTSDARMMPVRRQGGALPGDEDSTFGGKAGPNADSPAWVHRYFQLDQKEADGSITPAETHEMDALHQQAEKAYGSYDAFYKAHGGQQRNAGNLFSDQASPFKFTAGGRPLLADQGGIEIPEEVETHHGDSGKYPWQQTLGEFQQTMVEGVDKHLGAMRQPKSGFKADSVDPALWRGYVQTALDKGQPVPDHVVQQYKNSSIPEVPDGSLSPVTPADLRSWFPTSDKSQSEETGTLQQVGGLRAGTDGYHVVIRPEEPGDEPIVTGPFATPGEAQDFIDSEVGASADEVGVVEVRGGKPINNPFSGGARMKPKSDEEQHYIGGVIPDNPRLPIFTTTNKEGAQWFADNRGDGGKVHNVRVEAKNPFPLFSESDYKKLLPILDDLGIKYDYEPSSGGSRGWNLTITSGVKDHSPYDGTNPLDLVYIPEFRKALVARGYDSIKADDAMTNSEIPTTILIKHPSQMVRDAKMKPKNLSGLGPASSRVAPTRIPAITPSIEHDRKHKIPEISFH